MNVQLKRGVIELCALSLLEKKDRYGYELVEMISKDIAISEGSIYPLLRKFSKEEYVQNYWQESQSGPPRKYYKLTEKGQKALYKQRKDWKEFVKGVNRILEGGENE